MLSNRYRLSLTFANVSAIFFIVGYVLYTYFMAWINNPDSDLAGAVFINLWEGIGTLVLLVLSLLLLFNRLDAKQIRVLAGAGIVSGLFLTYYVPDSAIGYLLYVHFYGYCFSFTAKSPLRRTLAEWTLFFSLIGFATNTSATPFYGSDLNILYVMLSFAFVIEAGLLNVIRSNFILTVTHCTTLVLLLATVYYILADRTLFLSGRLEHASIQIVVILAYWFVVGRLRNKSVEVVEATS